MTETSLQRVDTKSLTAFILVVLLGGSNSVAIRFSNLELAPFWGAFLRLMPAALIYWAILLFRKMDLPTFKDSAVIAINGFISTGVGFALLYWGLQTVPVSLATVVISTGPLFTLVLAVLHRLESFRIQSLIGGLIAFSGLAIAINAQPGGRELIPGIIALLIGALISAEGNIIFKIYSVNSNPVSINALSLFSAAVFLGIASFFTQETWNLPSTSAGWTALAYLIIFGSVLMFYLFVYVLTRWTASSASYSILLFPLVATVFAALLANETITLPFILGGVIVLLGVWVGAFYTKPKTGA
ncbi:MAG TPA: DMT family transporter [Anaerolineales bacterium]|nr:DMT family transporter [Anaerolineales bacterium]HNO93270.1 DMT family transporter [Anaerolineales bacterium]